MKKSNRLFWGGLAIAAVITLCAAAQVPIVGTIINAVTGFTVNGAAPNNQMLCGNGAAAVFAPTCGSSHVSGTLTDVTGSRAIGTTYTNSGATAIYVSGYVVTNSGGDTSETTCTVNGSIVPWSHQSNATVIGFHTAFACMVPASGTYAVTTSGSESMTLGSWTEFAF